MNFASPWLLLALAATGLPVLLHLIGRRHAQRLPFAAMDFVLATDVRLARSASLRQWLLLALRIAIVAAAVLFVARPSMDAPAVAALPNRPSSVVLVVDDTLSMRFQQDGRSLFDAARQMAETAVVRLPHASEVALLRMSQGTLPINRLSSDRHAVLQSLRKMVASQRHATAESAWLTAVGMLQAGKHRQRSVWFFSDGSKHTGLAKLSPAGAELSHRVLRAGASHPRDNHAVVGLRVVRGQAAEHRARAIIARVCNFARSAIRLRVTLSVRDVDIASGFVVLPARGCVDKRFEHVFQHSGSHPVEVSTPADALPADDRRFAVVHLRDDIRVLLINGDPSPIRHQDETFYLAAALDSRTGGRRFVVTRVDAVRPGGSDWRPADVVVLANVRTVSDSLALRLKRFVESGGGLLITLGDQVAVQPFNDALADLLPRRLRGVTASHPAQPLRIRGGSSTHPLVRGSSALSPIHLGSARFLRSFRLRPVAEGRGRPIVLAFDDGSPALVERRVGRGRVLLYCSTVDREWNDLPIRPGFLPLMQRLTQYLARAVSPPPPEPLVVGQVASSRLQQQTDVQWTVREPAGIIRRLGRHGGLANYRPETAGFYEFSSVSRTGSRSANTVATNVDPRESDLELASRQGPDSEQGEGWATTAGGGVELWHALAVVLLLLLLGESFFTRRG